ncbi:MAG TPA: FlgD immunoglobulin-like domain containing protein [Candidatus Krumholzibacteria bacterium]|nr:FlgD immunoglobulin-like domain containing protein [Candidatus Krumholzibacteria bacterium]
MRTLIVMLLLLPVVALAQEALPLLPVEIGAYAPVLNPGAQQTPIDPLHVVRTTDGYLHAWDRATQRYVRMRRDGFVVASWGAALADPLAMAVDDSGFVYFADGTDLFRYDRSGGLILRESQNGSSPEDYRDITAMACDRQGNLWYGQPELGQTFVRSLSTAELRPNRTISISTYLPTAGITEFATVDHLACDARGNVFVVDLGSRHTYMFGIAGDADWCLPDTDHPDAVRDPRLVAADDEGSCYILEQNFNLTKVRLDGEPLAFREAREWGAVFAGEMVAITAGLDGSLMIAETVAEGGHHGVFHDCGFPPAMSAITDIPADQGGRVRLTWSASALDLVARPGLVTGYALYRRQPGATAAWEPPVDPAKAMEGWDVLGTVPARGDASYSYVAATFVDSTAAGGIGWSVFVVSAVTAHSLFFDAPADSGYSVDNLAPTVPVALAVTETPAGLVLTWFPSYAPDFGWYGIYRGAAPDFAPGDPLATFASSVPSTFTDTSVQPGETWYYRVGAFDVHGMFSGFSEAVGANRVSAVEAVPGAVMLRGNAPNPFNPRTRLSFYVPTAVAVTLDIHDAAGRRVVRLLDGVMAEGWHEVDWSGVDAAGRAQPSGLYFSRLQAGDEVRTGKMILNR